MNKITFLLALTSGFGDA